MTDRATRVGWFGDDPDRPAGTKDPGFQLYFLDMNALREADKAIWVRGESRAEFVIKTDRPMKQLTLTINTGPVASTVQGAAGGTGPGIHHSRRCVSPGHLRDAPGISLSED